MSKATELTSEYVNKDEINSEDIEDESKWKNSRNVEDLERKSRGQLEFQHDTLEDAIITEGCMNRDDCKVGLNIEEKEDLTKVEKSMEADDNALERKSIEECQYNIWMKLMLQLNM